MDPAWLTDLGVAANGWLAGHAPVLHHAIQLAQATDPNAPSKVVTTTIGTDMHPEDFSILAIFLRADVIVKMVVAILVVASVWSWGVIFEKWLLLRRVNPRSNKFEQEFWSGGSVDDLYEKVGSKPTSPMAAVFAAAMREWRRSTGTSGGPPKLSPGLGERIDRVMQVTLNREMGRIERYLGSLASVGSTAPFIGLFGTVWGIMNSFHHIALAKNASLVTVAPGISEALFATALGLVAAIPAVLAYNKLSTDFDRYAHRLEGFQGEFSAIVSRELESGTD
jgi:biopolymer transport protein TolQ